MPIELPASVQFLHKLEIGLGAWAWGDRIVWNYGRGYSDSDIEAGFKVSLENGINFVDTAEIYGNGRSETPGTAERNRNHPQRKTFW